MLETNEGRNRGNRVFQVDHECYIVYLGSEGYGVRPFLRVGTSPFLPDQIKRHIGSVVITDHLTGDFSIEADCLDPRSIKHTRYVGSADLVKAIKHFAHREQIPYQALEPTDGTHPPKGGQVVFFDDGNIRLYLDGHRLFDLTERERFDRHSVFRMTRIDAITKASRGAYRDDDFPGIGFIANQHGSILTYTGKRLFVYHHNEHDTLARWSYWGVPLSVIFGVENPVPASMLADLYRFRLVNGLAIGGAADSGEIIDVFRAAGVREDDTPPPQFPSGVPHPVVDAAERITLVLPEGASWSGDTPPPILPGVPYRYDGNVAHQEVQELLSGDLRETVDGADDPGSELLSIARRENLSGIDRVVAALWLWNRHSNTNDTQRVSEARATLETTFTIQHVPTIGVFSKKDDRWYVRFFLPRDLTRGAIQDNERAREKIEPFLGASADPGFLESERKRLVSFLQEMLAARRVEVAPETDEKTGAKKESGKAATRSGAPSPGAPSPGAPSPGAPTPKKAPGPTAGGSGTRKPSRSTTGTRTAVRSRTTPSRRPLVAVSVILLLLLLGGVLAHRFGAFPGIPVMAGIASRSDERSLEERPVAEQSPGEEPSGGLSPDEEPSGGLSPDEEPSGEDSSDGQVAPVTQRESSEQEPGHGSPDGQLPQDAPVIDASPDEPGSVVDLETGDIRLAITGTTDISDISDATDVDDGAGNDGPGRGTGASPWTVADVLRVTNWIAQENGYNRIGVNDLTGEQNPNWIYPGNTFRLPDGIVHEVVSGETLWFIASSFLNEIFVASEMELSRFRDLIDSEEYPVEELERRRIN